MREEAGVGRLREVVEGRRNQAVEVVDFHQRTVEGVQ
jgi:hypothetical protein